MIEVSHLVVNGCSFTYCQGLDNPHIEGWPAILSRMLNVPVVNLAIGGSGNDAIYRRTYEYFYKDNVKNNKPLYILAFSGSARKEEFFYEYQNRKVNDFIGLRLSFDDGPPEDFEQSYIVNLDYKAREKLKLVYWAALINLFKSNNINYYTTDFFPPHDENLTEFLMKNSQELYEVVHKDPNRLINFTEIIRRLKKLPCGHIDKIGNIAIANYLYEKLIDTHKAIVPVDLPYLHLKDFYEPQTLQRFDFNPWIYKYVFTKQI